MRSENNYKDDHNKVLIEGIIEKSPEFHHKVFNEGVYTMIVSIPRLNSDNKDHILVNVSDRLIDLDLLKEGLCVRVRGQFRSFNRRGDKLDGKAAKLQLAIFARDIELIERTLGENKVSLEGFICREPNYRKTPLGREICDMMIAVNRAYNKSDYLPAISWGRNARFVSGLKVGTGVSVEGRLQSRVYRKKLDSGEVVERTAYEVSVFSIVLYDDKLDKVEVKV